MKKLLFVLVAFVFFCTSDLFAQVRIGVKGGVNYGTVTQEIETDLVKRIFGPQAGLVVYSSLDNPLFVQSGVLYSVKGAKMDGLEDEDLGDLDVKVTYNFVEVPLNIGFQIPVGGSVKVSPYVGGFAGYAISGKLKMGGVTFDIFDLDDLEEEGADPKRFDYGANAGLGLHFNDRVIFSAQYSHGLANIGDPDGKVQTRTLSAGLSFLF